MCGLVGMVGKITAIHEKVFKDMLCFDVVRGPHSTGVVGVSDTGNMGYTKACLLPSDLFQLRQYKDATGGVNSLLMGHNRYATMGAVNQTNAHPFDHKNVIGMHNGTLVNWRRSLNKANYFDVDSDCLMHNISEYGAEDTLPDVEGAYALTWYDKVTEEFNVIRNKERPLWWALSKDGKTILYASEPWMISAACWRHELKINEPEPLQEQSLVTWKVPRVNEPLDVPREKKIKAYVRPPLGFCGGQVGRAGRQNNALPPPANTTGVPDQKNLLNTLVNKKVTFCILSYLSAGNRGYLVGTLEGYEFDVEVRVFMSKDDANIWLEYSDHDFEGVVKFANHPYYVGDKLQGGSLIIDPKTVNFAEQFRGVPPKDDDVPFDNEESNVIGFPTASFGPDGAFVTEEEWDKLTDKGCDNCTTNLFYGDEVCWVAGGNAVLCKMCAEEINEEAKEATKQ